ncbi:MAG: TetR/AcrR family transcriptional regulator [Deltaproteobacteria bacterium]|nr:TetR/AcrR family transcriptional regulator [Deltaproteobacteria bacterium]MBW2726061.1 TetR/AcrR family transcriptional regulator [Deltaproteobacteria bacterium]
MSSETLEDEPIARRRILDAARARFESAGYKGTSIAHVAREAGVAVGTVYRHFENKEAMLVSVLRETNERWLETARAALSSSGTAIERMMRIAEASVVFNRENQLLNAIWTRNADFIVEPLLNDLYRWAFAQNVALVAEVIRDGIAEGTLRDCDPDRTAYVLFNFGHSVFGQKDVPYSDLVPTMTDIILNGIRERD